MTYIIQVKVKSDDETETLFEDRVYMNHATEDEELELLRVCKEMSGDNCRLVQIINTEKNSYANLLY